MQFTKEKFVNKILLTSQILLKLKYGEKCISAIDKPYRKGGLNFIVCCVAGMIFVAS